MKTVRISTIAIAAALATSSFAATDGTLGSTSTGTTDITLTKGDGVQISGVTDVLFGATSTVPAAQNMDSCIYSTTGNYTLEAQSANTDGTDFRMSDGAATPSFINYTLEWDDTVAAATGTALAESTVVAGFANAFTADPTCGGGASGRLIVTVDGATFAAAPSGNFADTLTLIVAPN